jgi:hypothetical protein
MDAVSINPLCDQAIVWLHFMSTMAFDSIFCTWLCYQSSVSSKQWVEAYTIHTEEDSKLKHNFVDHRLNLFCNPTIFIDHMVKCHWSGKNFND